MAVLLSVGAGVAAAATCSAVSPAYTVALIELYTSQGCSSCPPADRWLSRLPAGQPLFHAIPIAWHVGYWDYIGWKDPFAAREFNDRQYWLAGRSGSRGVYTPQVFVGASELADWNHPSALAAALDAVARRAARATIELQARWLAPGAGAGAATQRLAVRARWSADPAARAPQLLLAVKRDGYMTPVRAGENAGATLRNDHVVRAWAGPFKPASSGPSEFTTELAIPSAPGDATLVAIAQDAGAGILQAVELPLAACEAAALSPTR